MNRTTPATFDFSNIDNIQNYEKININTFYFFPGKLIRFINIETFDVCMVYIVWWMNVEH